MADVVVNDEYINGMIEFINSQSQQFEECIAKYNLILLIAKVSGAYNGEFADALGKFSEASAKLSGQLDTISQVGKTLLSGYLSEIDEADKYLY